MILVESIFGSLRECDPNDVATIMDSVIDEDDPQGPGGMLSKKVDGSFVARQLATDYDPNGLLLSLVSIVLSCPENGCVATLQSSRRSR